MVKKELKRTAALASLAVVTACAPSSAISKWEATYCSREGCPPKSSEVVRSGYLFEDDPRECPPTRQVQIASVDVGDVSVPIYSTYHIKEDSCHFKKLKR